jgi:hypothetical protein
MGEHNRRAIVMWRGKIIGTLLCAGTFSSICLLGVLGLTGCGGDEGPTPGALAITTTSLPEGTINRPYSASVSGSGGALPYTWSVSPALPANLSLDPATGAITGTPTTQGTTTHAFALRDTSAPSQTVEQTLTLTIDPPLAITTTSLPDASINSSYNQSVETVGGTGALTFNIVPGTGTLPQNFTLNPTTGIISGTPTAPAGTFPFTVRVTDEGGQQDTQALAVRVTPTTPPNITSTSLSGGTVGVPYSQRVQATGGIGSLAWSISAGSLPAGLTLEASGPTGGTISGIPSSGGPSNFTVTITDSVGQTDTQALSINVTPFSITTTSLPSGSIGQFYSEPVETVGGTTPLNFSIVAPGTLPPGLTLHPTTGLISGMPGVPAGTSTFTVRVADAAGRQDTQALSITINLFNAPNITTTTLQAGTVDQAYSQPVQVTGGSGALTWSISAGTLPPGLELNQTNGTISGTPTTEGTSNFTVTVTDSLGQTDTQVLSIDVSAAPLVITTTSLPGGGIGQFYTQPVIATGGTAPLTFSISSGTLPPDLALDQRTGVISGTPVLVGAYSFTVRVADTGGQEVTQALSIAINLIVIP